MVVDVSTGAVGVSVLIVYAFQLGAMITSNNINRDNFMADQTPYLWAEIDPPLYVDGKPLSLNLEISNYGKSPANNIRECSFSVYGVPIEPNLHKLTLNECNKNGRQVAQVGSVLPPGAPKQKIPIIFSGSAYHDADDWILSQRDDIVAIQGIFVYNDSFGRAFEYGFCFHRLKDGTMIDCGVFSYIKEIKDENND